MSGIVAFGAYVPALRLQREAIFAAHGWLNPALERHAAGELAVCNWDEDALTMAVEAGRTSTPIGRRREVGRLVVASTSMPLDRAATAVVTEALGLPDEILCLDVRDSMRCGLTAARTALEATGNGDPATLLIASDRQQAQPASLQEMWLGSGAAALIIGDENVVARYVGGFSITADFVDRLRTNDRSHYVHWEERWLRDEGCSKLMPDAIRGLLRKLALTPEDVTHLAVSAPMPGAAASIGAAVDVPAHRIADDLHGVCGNIGSAHPLLLLISVLERARPGDRILVCAFGQGCEALLFEATEHLPEARGQLHGTTAALSRRLPEPNYLRHLVGAGQLDVHTDRRAAARPETPLSVAWRERKALLGFIGGRCTACGTLQFPPAERCVNPACHAAGRQEGVSFAERRARLVTWTADRLACSPRPPLYYGIVDFDGGGRVLMEFADVGERALSAGMPVWMVFRLRPPGDRSGWRSYFWKATPMMQDPEE